MLNGESMAFLKCKYCGGCYELQPGETPADFESCNCGGELEFYDSHGRKTRFKPIYAEGRPRSSTDSPLVRLILILVAFLVITKGMGGLVMGLVEATSSVGPTEGFYIFAVFIVIFLATAVFLLRFIFKK